MSSMRRRRPTPELVWLLVLMLPALLPLTAPGYFNDAHDAPHSVFFLVQMDQAIRDGALWPRWGPDHALGLGYPLWLLYAPLAYYVAELFRILGAGFTVAVKWTWALASVTAALSMYALVRRWWGKSAGLVAGLLYAYAPYHLLDMYVRAALAEYASLSLLPLVLLAYWDLIRLGGRWRIATAALAYAALILTHSVTAVLASPLLAAFVLCTVWSSRRRGAAEPPDHRSLPRSGVLAATPITDHEYLTPDPPNAFRGLAVAAAAAALAIGLSAIYLAPMLLERQYIVQEQWVHATYQYQQHFVYAHQFLSPAWGYGYAVAGPEDGMSFQLGLLPVLLALAGVFGACRRRGRNRGLVAFFALAAALFIWLMTASSSVLWDLAAPVAALVQFPWRLLSLTSLALAVLGGSALVHLSRLCPETEEPRSKQQDRPSRAPPVRPSAVILLLVIVLASFPYTQPQLTEITARSESPLAVIDFELEYPDMRGMTIWAGRLPEPEDTPLVDDYLAGRPLTKARILSGDGVVTMLRHGGASEEISVTTAAGARLQFYTYWFPGWVVRVDGQVVETWPEGPNGLITFDVPPGEHHVRLRMTEGTAPRRVGGILSALSLAAVVALLAWRPRARRR